jgi:hypothetical protein
MWSCGLPVSKPLDDLFEKGGEGSCGFPIGESPGGALSWGFPVQPVGKAASTKGSCRTPAVVIMAKARANLLIYSRNQMAFKRMSNFQTMEAKELPRSSTDGLCSSKG